MTEREDWPIGPALRRARESRGLSIRAAAEKTHGAISYGRWSQLESGVQKLKGQSIPIGTTRKTVIAAARAVDLDVDTALRLANMAPLYADSANEPLPPESGRREPSYLPPNPSQLAALPTSAVVEHIHLLLSELDKRARRAPLPESDGDPATEGEYFYIPGERSAPLRSRS